MKPRRGLIFSFAYYPLFIGGAEIAIKEITDRIAPSDIQFDLISLHIDAHLPAVEKIGNVTVYRVGWTTLKPFKVTALPWFLNLSKYVFLYTAVRKALELSRTEQYDFSWSIMASYSSFAAVIFKLFRPQIPYLLTLQDGDPIAYIKRRALPLYPLFRMIFTRATRIQTISEYLAGWAREMGARCPITVVPNAVDYALFSAQPDVTRLGEIKAKLGKKDDTVLLVTTSRLVEKNAIHDIIESLTFLPSQVRLLILGTGHLEAELKTLAVRLKLSDRISFLGFVPHAETPLYLHVSDIFIRPSLSEGLGISFLEAMAAGLPVIATNVGGIPDFLTDGETGLFCEVHNPKSIAQKVDKLMKDRESRDYIIKNAREMVRAKYEWNDIALVMKRIIDELSTVQ